MKVPSNIKVFLWRACSKILPTRGNLWKRKCAQEPICGLFGKDEETMEHMLLLCDWTRDIWLADGCELKVDKMR